MEKSSLAFRESHRKPLSLPPDRKEGAQTAWDSQQPVVSRGNQIEAVADLEPADREMGRPWVLSDLPKCLTNPRACLPYTSCWVGHCIFLCKLV